MSLEIQRDNIPISPLTLRVSENVGFDPFNLISSGMLIAVIPPDRVIEAQAELETAGIASGIAGRFVRGEKLELSTCEELWGILGQ